MINRDREIVSAIRSRLVDRLGTERFELWFGPSIRISNRDNSVIVEANSAFRLERLRKNHLSDLESVTRELLGGEASVEFAINAELHDEPSTPQDASASDGPSSEPPTISLAANRSAGSPSAGSSQLAAARPSQAQRPRLAGRRFSSLDSLIVGPSNQLAYESAKLVLDRPGEMTPLLIHGPTGVGKTHLLEGMWTSVRRQGGRRVVYLSAEQFTTYFLQALRGGGLPSFRQKYRAVDMLIVDDLQFFVGKQATINELLHTMDALFRDSKQMVLASDRAPAELQNLGPELITRISGGLICGVEPFGIETRLEILEQLAAKRKTTVSPEVLEYIAERVPGDARQLVGVLNRLSVTGQALGQPITIDLANRVIEELFPEAYSVVRLNDIQRVVCDEFDIPPEMLKSDSRSRHVSHPRMLAMWLARKHTRAALTEISEFFGRRSHSTVVSAQNKVDDWVVQGEQMQGTRRECKVEDVLSRLERVLRA